MYSIMLMTSQELCKACGAPCRFILFYFGTSAKRLHNSCARVFIFCFILLQKGERLLELVRVCEIFFRSWLSDLDCWTSGLPNDISFICTCQWL